ncbi:MAG: cyclopropane-fatty-acyl-phospholipid synthase family protein [Lysobacterales bacterium]
MDSTAELARTDKTASLAADNFYRRRLFALLQQLQGCLLDVHDRDGVHSFGDGQGEDVLHANLKILDADFWRQAALGGSVGVGEAYMDGLWESEHLTELVQIFARNQQLTDAMEGGLARLGAAALRWYHRLRRNTRQGSRRNIAEHYDLGNDLFSLFLDRNLMYSSAIFRSADESLDTASERKLDRICDKLELRPEHHLLEIGTGWGGFALHAARRHGCRVTTTTISAEQHRLATQRVAEAGLSDRITVLQQDYRDLQGEFDRIVSIEMVEAVGHHFLDQYFGVLSQRLKPNGLALLQAITIEDHRFEQALKSVDFIKRHVFPGSFIPSITALLNSATRRSDMKLVNLEDIGPSYSLTLRHWHQRFLQQLDQVRALGYSERFVRLWRWYLAYCEGGFLERTIGDVQLLFAKPRNRRLQYLPDLKPSL